MNESDQLATSFITPFDSYCYVTMPLGLKNAGAMFQRTMVKCFDELVGETVEVYVDDIIVKTKEANQLVYDLGLTFAKIK
jgi:hypothetical protein